MLIRPASDQVIEAVPGHQQWWLLVHPDEHEEWAHITQYLVPTNGAQLGPRCFEVSVENGILKAFAYDVKQPLDTGLTASV